MELVFVISLVLNGIDLEEGSLTEGILKFIYDVSTYIKGSFENYLCNLYEYQELDKQLNVVLYVLGRKFEFQEKRLDAKVCVSPTVCRPSPT